MEGVSIYIRPGIAKSKISPELLVFVDRKTGSIGPAQGTGNNSSGRIRSLPWTISKIAKYPNPDMPRFKNSQPVPIMIRKGFSIQQEGEVIV